MLKRFFIIITISLVLTGSFFSAYNFNCTVFADDSLPSGYTPVTDDIDLAYAFNAYCKSRDLDIISTVPGASITYIYNYIKEYCSAFGYNIDSMQEQLFKSVNDSSTPAVVKWYMKTGLIGMYNDIFAQFIRENDLEVGDTVNDKSLYDGKYYNGCFFYIINNSSSTINGTYPLSQILQRGSYYQYTGEQIFNTYGVRYSFVPFTAFGSNYTLESNGSTWTSGGVSYYTLSLEGLNIYTTMPESRPNDQIYEGMPCLIFNTYNNNYYLGVYNHLATGAENIKGVKQLTANNDVQPVNIYITTNNNTINNNNYEGDTVINNNGDINNYPDNPDNPDNPDTPDPPTIPDSGGWQDFSLPEMPNDWLIYGMEKKFPFDIPFNILFGLSLLNHEPEIPQFEGDIDLKVCIWHYDIDLTPFDDIAKILRKFEVLAFIIGLAMITKELIMWG